MALRIKHDNTNLSHGTLHHRFSGRELMAASREALQSLEQLLRQSVLAACGESEVAMYMILRYNYTIPPLRVQAPCTHNANLTL